VARAEHRLKRGRGLLCAHLIAERLQLALARQVFDMEAA
jgi:hypothetical protein